MPALDLLLLFHALPGRYLILNPELVIVEASDAYLTATMTKRLDVIGHPLFEVFPDNPDDPQADGVDNLRASLTRVLQNHTPDAMAVQKYDIRRPESDGGGFEVRYWSPLNSPVLTYEGELTYIVHRVEDVTEFLRLKDLRLKDLQKTQDLQAQTEEMEAEIVRRSQELQESNNELRAANIEIKTANAAKSDFLSRMSHELRTPMTAILGFGELLQLEEADQEHREWISLMLKAGRHLLELLNDVLDISRVETGHLSMSLEPVAVAPLLKDAFDLMRPLTTSYNVELKGDVGDSNYYILADRQRLRQVLINLISNAAKYNRKNGTISLKVEKNTEDHICISVTDTGAGLDEVAIAKIFHPFERLDAQQNGIDGIGLGLALSRNLVETMNGEIGVTSKVGKGSTFWVSFPIIEPAAIDVNEQFQNNAIEIHNYATAKTVLYVEDTTANVQLLQEIFKRRPMVSLITAGFGALALEMAHHYKPDLIMLDLHLPDIGGDEVLFHLKTEEDTKAIPVVILSADATKGRADDLIDQGAAEYLTKPISVKTLLDLVDKQFDEE